MARSISDVCLEPGFARGEGQTATMTLNAGDVLQMVGGNAAGDDLSGSLVLANKPVQVITGMPCRNVPIDAAACDHIEESVLPVETWGKEYLVTVPAAPSGQGAAAVGHVVRLVGNVVRRQLNPATTHRIESGKPVGIQVYGYGDYTSYQVPGGLGLEVISPAPQ